MAKTSDTDTHPCALCPLRIKPCVTLSLSLSMMLFVLHLSSHAASEDHHINLYTHSFTCGVIHLPVVERTEGKSAFWASANWSESQCADKSCSIISFLSLSKGSFQRRNWTPQAMLYLKGTRTLALYFIWLCDGMSVLVCFWFFPEGRRFISEDRKEGDVYDRLHLGINKPL